MAGPASTSFGLCKIGFVDRGGLHLLWIRYDCINAVARVYVDRSLKGEKPGSFRSGAGEQIRASGQSQGPPGRLVSTCPKHIVSRADEVIE